MVPWTCPVLISGFLTTGSIMGVVAQLCGLAVSFLIWLPFIRVPSLFVSHLTDTSACLLFGQHLHWFYLCVR